VKNQRDASPVIRLAGMAILGLFIALAAAAYLGGREVKRSSELITTDAVPGTIAAHYMRMAMSRSIGWVMVAASAETPQSRDASLKTVHDADVAFTNAVKEYETTIKINPAQDRALLARVTGAYAEFYRQRMAYEALILAGNRDRSAALLERNVVPAYVAVIQPAEELIKYNHANSITYANQIRDSVYRLYWAVAVVMVLALICVAVLVVNFAIRRREITELRESEELFRTSFESATVGVCLVATDGRFINVNRTLCDMLGYAKEELLRLTFSEITHEEDREVGTTFLTKALSGGPKSMQMEKRYLHKEGRIVWALLSTALVEQSREHGGFVISYVQDITERKRAVEQLEMLKVSIDQHFDAAYWMDAGNRFVYVNDSACKALGYAREELLGKPLSMIAPDATPHVLEEVWKRLRETGFFTREGMHRRKDGSLFPVELVASYVRFEGKEFNCGFARDITERKRAQDELIWKTALLEAQVDSTLDGILVVDTMGRKILQNHQFIGMFKVPEEIVRDDDDAKLLRHAINQMKNPGQFTERVTYLYAHPDEIGSDEIELADGRVFDRYSAPVRDQAGKRYGRIWMFRDITGRRKLEEQFRQSQKMEAVGQLASGVAHDFNNILSVIQLQSELLKSDGGLSAKQKEYAADIGDSAQRAAALTRQLLLFSRKEKMQTRALDLNQCINDLTKMLRRTLGEHVQLQFRFAMQSLIVRADPGMMDQVLMNLVVNARDAMPKGGDLIIKTAAVELDELAAAQFPLSRPGSFVCLSVSDAGCGIPSEIMPKIFEPFFTTKEVGKGTGLGLATVFGIVQQHQGWISVRSEVGRGTTFEVYLPLVSGADDGKETRNSWKTVAGGNETVLLVEDEYALRTVIRTTLVRLGYRVLEAGTGAEALKTWDRHQSEIALLLTDLVMPGGMTGKELAESLLQKEPKLKVIYLSGYSPDTANQDFKLEEGVNFFTKPFQTHKLAQAIRDKLDKLT